MALSISLLGPPQIRLERELISDLRSDKALALLAYLAVESDRAHRREKLAGMLWPDYTEASARGNLRRALADLRRAIGDHQATPPYLDTTRQSIQFNTASDYWLDVDAFTRPTGELAGPRVCVGEAGEEGDGVLCGLAGGVRVSAWVSLASTV